MLLLLLLLVVLTWELDLNLLGNKGSNLGGVSVVRDEAEISVLRNAKSVSNQVCSSTDEMHVKWVLFVEGNRGRCALGS